MKKVIPSLLLWSTFGVVCFRDGQSKAYNQEKVTEEKGKQHVTDEYLDK